jgi:cytoskeletal protein RodZ
MAYEDYIEDNYYGKEKHGFDRDDSRGSFSDDLNNADELERERQEAIQKKYVRESSGRKKRRKKRKKKSEKNQYLLIAVIIVIVAILFCLALAFIIENEDIDVYSPSDITYVEPNNNIALA